MSGLGREQRFRSGGVVPRVRRPHCSPAPLLFLLVAAIVAPASARAEWQRDSQSLAWCDAGGAMVWRFSFDPAAGKPYLHPLTVGGGPSLTNFKPEDHPWHYGLWFSWKYINRVNYWEEPRETGHAEGRTRWTPPQIETQPDGAAVVKLALRYENPAGEIVLREVRTMTFSAPGADGGYAIDWQAEFTVGAAAITLDRTPMTDEPGGQVNGGYAGLGVRLAGAPLAAAFVTTNGAVGAFVHDRARPAAPALAVNFGREPAASVVGGLAVFSDPQNAGDAAPWYLVDSAQMRFVCAAILAPAPRAYAAGAEFILRYRIVMQRESWTAETLRRAATTWREAGAAR